MARSTIGRITRLTAAVEIAAAGVVIPTQAASADPLCPLGICLPLPGGDGGGGGGGGGDDTVVVIDLEGVGTAVGGLLDTVVGGVAPGLPVGDLPIGDLPAVGGLPVGGVVGAVLGGNGGAVGDVGVDQLEGAVNDLLDTVTDVVDDTLDGLGLGGVVEADVLIPVDLTEGVVVAPVANASVDLGGATGNLPVPIADLLDADINASLCGVDVVVLADHSQDCTAAGPAPLTVSNPALGDVKLPIDVCGVQVVVAGSDQVDCSVSGGNQNGGATGLLSDALVALGLDVAVCGIQVAVAGNADADCTGRNTGIDTELCLAGELCIDLDVPELCGISLGVGGLTNVVCYPEDDPTDPTPPGGDDDDPTPTDPGDDDGDDNDDGDNDNDGDDDDTGDTPEGVPGADDDTDDTDGTGGGGGGGNDGGHGLRGGELPHTGVAITSMLLCAAALVAGGTAARRVQAGRRTA